MTGGTWKMAYNPANSRMRHSGPPHPAPKFQDKHIAQVAKRVFNKNTETKSFIGPTTVKSSFDDFLYFQNLVSPIAEGAGSENRLGERINVTSLKVNWKATLYNTSTQTETKIMRLMVISTPKQLGTSTGTLTQSDVFRSPSSLNAAKGVFDFHKVSVLYDKKIIVNPATQGNNDHRCGMVNVRLNKNLIFQDDASPAYLKNVNYYFVFGYVTSAGVLGYMDLHYNVMVNFKDS
jgi:hypothetical protein